MRQVTKEMREVELVTILCDLCGKSEGMPRYAKNRTCEVCQREVCGKCQGPYPENEEGFSMAEDTICVICKSMEEEYCEPINETYRERDRLKQQWKENSLARTPKAGAEDKRGE